MVSVYNIFQDIDEDKSGRLSQEQLARGLVKLGIKQDAAELMEILDMDKNGYISYTEFMAGALSSDVDISKKLLHQAFDMFDLDGDGYISMYELRLMLSGDGPLVEVLPDGYTVDQLMEEIGDSSGSISFEHFKDYLTSGAETTAPRSTTPR